VKRREFITPVGGDLARRDVPPGDSVLAVPHETDYHRLFNYFGEGTRES
jgi:hypothetical protein